MNEESLRILESAVSDVGFWRWWLMDDDLCQLEFGGVQLYAYKDDKRASQSGVIALRFGGSPAMTFYSKNVKGLGKNWFKLLQEDKLKPFPVAYDGFGFNKKELANEIVSAYPWKKVMKKAAPGREAACTLAFRAGDVAVVTAGQTLRVLTHSGELDDAKIKEASLNWWEYWKEYWEAAKTDRPFEKDYACEVTIPAGGD